MTLPKSNAYISNRHLKEESHEKKKYGNFIELQISCFGISKFLSVTRMILDRAAWSQFAEQGIELTHPNFTPWENVLQDKQLQETFDYIMSQSLGLESITTLNTLKKEQTAIKDVSKKIIDATKIAIIKVNNGPFTSAVKTETLIGLNKNDIIEIAKSIGTYDISITISSKVCPFVPFQPATKARLKDVLIEESKLDLKLNELFLE